MASKLLTAIGGSDSSDDSSPKTNPVVAYKIEAKDDERGVPTLRLLAKRADGSGSKYGNLIIWLDQPGSARALAAALPQFAKALAMVDKLQTEAGEWPKVATEAPKASTPATPAASAKSKVAAAFDDLPF